MENNTKITLLITVKAILHRIIQPNKPEHCRHLNHYLSNFKQVDVFRADVFTVGYCLPNSVCTRLSISLPWLVLI